MKKESKNAKEGYILYRDMGNDRTIEKVAEIMKSRLYVVKKWKDEWNWDERLNGENQSSMNSMNIKSMLDEHMEMSLQISKSLEKIIEIFTEKITKSDEYFNKMELDDLIKLLNNYIKSIPQVLDYLQDFACKPIKEKEIEETFSIYKLISKDEPAMKLSLELLSRISGY